MLFQTPPLRRGWLLVLLAVTVSAPGTARAEPGKPGPAVQALARTCQAKAGGPAASTLKRMTGSADRRGWTVVAPRPTGKEQKPVAKTVGKVTGKFVLEVDLLKVVSRYIGETEKNLERLFSDATRRDAVLFFDEADALFGKRTDYRKLKNSWANKQSPRILKRIRAYPGVVILGTREPLTAEAGKAASKTTDVILPEKVTAKKLWTAICQAPAK